MLSALVEHVLSLCHLIFTLQLRPNLLKAPIPNDQFTSYETLTFYLKAINCQLLITKLPILLGPHAAWS